MDKVFLTQSAYELKSMTKYIHRELKKTGKIEVKKAYHLYIFFLLFSTERAHIGLRIPATAEIGATSPGRSRQTSQRNHFEAGCRFSRSPILNAKVSFLNENESIYFCR